MPTNCPSCCIDCLTTKPTPCCSYYPYALPNLLQAGTVTLNVSGIVSCDHNHAEDDWHRFDASRIISHLTEPHSIIFCQELDFLVKQFFVSLTYRFSDDGQMILRVYLIPYDLPNVQGRLRVRKSNILNPAKRYMRTLLSRIIQDHDGWLGLPLTGDAKELIRERIVDSRTLSDIYGDLSSPAVTPVLGLGNIASRLLDFDDDLEGLGMRSKLYRYQRRSVAAMLQKELDTQDVANPLYILVHALDGKVFYLQPGTSEILLECPMTAPCRGGILCEELGTGKTVMMISLIVATMSQIPSPEQSIVDERVVLTPLALRHFPSGDFASARKRLYRSPGSLDLQQSEFRVPSLVELLLHHHRVNPHCDLPDNQNVRTIEREDQLQNLPLGEALRANVPFYHHFSGEPHNMKRTKRNEVVLGPRIMYLTSATLVIVPPNLLSQWDREITKHCAIPLRVLILRSKTPLPSVKNLATDFDIILMTYTRFTAQHDPQNEIKLHTWNECKCPELPGFRVPDCNCQVAEVSPLLQIRWKRLVIDEGHVSATLSTVLLTVAKKLSVERRWIVTGTPTTNLLGLGLGSKVTECLESPSKNKGRENASAFEEAEEGLDWSEVASSFSSQVVTPAGSPSPATPVKRIWNKYDREDLNKLGNMITQFIAVPQFSTDPSLMATHVTEALLDPSGPRRGAIQVLNQVMQLVMIRHRIEDVEQDVVLPSVTHESVLLDLDPYVIKSFNALQAAIVVNAVDSQRTDQDYLFHPRNADYLQGTVNNMWQLLFWHVDDRLYNADELVKNANEHIQRAIKRGVSEEDISLLKSAFHHLEIASEDSLWRAMQTHEDVPYRVFNMVNPVFDAWTRMPGKDSTSNTGFLHADRLLKLYDMVIQRPLICEAAMVEWGQAVAVRDQAFRKAYEESSRKSKGGRKAKHNSDGDHHPSGSILANDFARKASSASTLKEIQTELDATLARLSSEEEAGPSADNAPMSSSSSVFGRTPGLVASSPLARIRIGSSASTKLNYIINQVQTYATSEKFLIFSDSPLTLAHIAEALELIHVKFLRFTTQVLPQFREQLVLTFETSEAYRVLLMELKHGARGLNLISASRVIFCEPVWRADVESQAIKRAHRIGQLRAITVKTLAIRGTAEERMVDRRNALKNSQDKLPKLIEEAGMRHYIANPKFITQTPTLIPTIDFAFIDLPPESAPPPVESVMLRIPPLHTPPRKRIRVEEPAFEPSTSTSAKPAGKKIRFAD